jgi:hypothetical protein
LFVAAIFFLLPVPVHSRTLVFWTCDRCRKRFRRFSRRGGRPATPLTTRPRSSCPRGTPTSSCPWPSVAPAELSRSLQ